MKKVSDCSKEEIIDAYEKNESINKSLLYLGISKTSTQSKNFKLVLEDNAIPIKKKNKLQFIGKKVIEESILKSRSLNELAKKIGYISQKENLSSKKYYKLRNFLIENEMLFENIKKEEKNNSYNNSYTNEELFIKDSPACGGTLKKRYKKILENKNEYKCAICGNQDIWENKKIVLQLDHINGIRNDNRVENLRFLCPNCHSQTNTWCGKNLS